MLRPRATVAAGNRLVAAERPARSPPNLAFGDRGRRQLFITESDTGTILMAQIFEPSLTTAARQRRS